MRIFGTIDTPSKNTFTARRRTDGLPRGVLYPPGPVLCLAEGEGRNAVYLATQGRDVTAVDQSEVGLAKAARLAAARGVSVKPVHADLRDYVIEPGVWSGIVAIFAHLPPQLRRKVHAVVVSGLRPGGVMILEAYTPAQLSTAPEGQKRPNC